jgi:chemotaxis protein CheC
MTSANDVPLDEMEVDALTELVNIGVSRAAVSLRELVGEQVLLSVPSLAILSRAKAGELVSQGRPSVLIAVRQGFQGEFSGRALLIFPETTSLELVRIVAGRGLSLEDVVELEQEALAEIGNIVLNGCMASIANLLHRSLTMSLPEVIRGTGAQLFGHLPSGTEDVVLFVRINFSVKGHEISGYLAMVMDLLSLVSLKSLIVEFIRRSTHPG